MDFNGFGQTTTHVVNAAAAYVDPDAGYCSAARLVARRLDALRDRRAAIDAAGFLRGNPGLAP